MGGPPLRSKSEEVESTKCAQMLNRVGLTCSKALFLFRINNKITFRELAVYALGRIELSYFNTAKNT